MAKIEELIKEIANERLRDALLAEVKALKETVPFGLVFEEHLPERVRLPNIKIRPGELVSEKRQSGNDVWRVTSISGDVAQLEREKLEEGAEPETTEMSLSELVVVRSFGEAIYPALIPVDRVERGGPDKPWHVLINADNFHALQLLLYCYEGKVDVIYIDPPYNTGARDWKYNNDFVDRTDAFRHSKWLSMIKKRLVLAKRLLKDDGVLIVTIDEHEVFHLGMLLNELFPEFSRQMVSIVINQKGVVQGNLARVEEYAMFAFSPAFKVETHHDDLLSPDQSDSKRFQTPRWEWLLRGGSNSRRVDRPNLFYPIFIDPETKRITGVGEVLPLVQQPDLSNTHTGTVAWPIRTDGSFGNWRAKPSTLRELNEGGYVKLGGFDKKRNTWTILYLNRVSRNRIESGEIVITGRDSVTGAFEVAYFGAEARKQNIKTVWHRGHHDSGIYGSSVLRSFVGNEVSFAFPKSLYAVRDTLGTVIRSKKDALIVDFFAGSGTTLHATALLNTADSGNRKCILVTNNEVEEKVAKQLLNDGIFPGDQRFEAFGICNTVTWPRVRNAIVGNSDSGKPIEGNYLDGSPYAEGLSENLEYFRLDFLDPHDVARGDAFKAILPILWLMSGGKGQRDDSKGSTDWFLPKNSPFAVLVREKGFKEFIEAVGNREDIEWLFLVTDSEENFGLMRRTAGKRYKCVQLYKSYLENFQINTADAMREVER